MMNTESPSSTLAHDGGYIAKRHYTIIPNSKHYSEFDCSLVVKTDSWSNDVCFKQINYLFLQSTHLS